jgi:hypothetical protein
MKKINVGISIAAQQDVNIWDSGLNQNLAFLLMLLRQIPRVGKVYLLQVGAEGKLPAGFDLGRAGAELVDPHSVTHDLDLVIEFGASLPLEWLRHLRALGTHVVAMLVGHTYAGQAEPPMFGTPASMIFIGSPWQEVWTLPHHMKTSAPMLRTVARVPVHEVPHIWSPLFLDSQIAQLAARGLRFGFENRSRQRVGPAWRLAVFEPNISVVKNCFIPMLVCDAAYRKRKDAVGLMMVMNTFHMKEHATFNTFATHLDLTRDSKASYEPRLAFADCMTTNQLDAVVAHQWECGLNYAYYDALHGGYPLIHNSEFLMKDGVGFYYPHFEAGKGAEALLAAWAKEPGYWKDYRDRSSRHLATLAPDHPANVAAFAQRIDNLVGGHDGQA